jgi:hypothetical protein
VLRPLVAEMKAAGVLIFTGGLDDAAPCSVSIHRATRRCSPTVRSSSPRSTSAASPSWTLPMRRRPGCGQEGSRWPAVGRRRSDASRRTWNFPRLPHRPAVRPVLLRPSLVGLDFGVARHPHGMPRYPRNRLFEQALAPLRRLNRQDCDVPDRQVVTEPMLQSGACSATMALCQVFRSKMFPSRRTPCCGSALQPRTSRCRSTCGPDLSRRLAGRRWRRSWTARAGGPAGQFR